MPRLAYHPQPPLNATTAVAKRWLPTGAIWGAGIGTAALFFLSVTPLVKREFLTKFPILGDYYTDKTPASDKPF